MSRWPMLVAASVLAACAAVTGLSEYSVSEDDDAGTEAGAATTSTSSSGVTSGASSTSGSSSSSGGASSSSSGSADDAAPPYNGVECGPDLVCGVNGQAAECCISLTSAAACGASSAACADGGRLSFACDEPSDCPAGEDCCVGVGLLTQSGKTLTYTGTSSCAAHGSCKKDAGANALYRESCLGTCATGSCTSFTYDAGGPWHPKLRYCAY